MLNLADYGGSSDEDDFQDESFETKSEDEKPAASSSSGLLSALPKPAESTIITKISEDDDFLEDEVTKKHFWEIEAANRAPSKNKSKAKVKIFLPEAPAANEDSDSETETLETTRPVSDAPTTSSSAASQLLSLLPAPKIKTAASLNNLKPKMTLTQNTTIKNEMKLLPASVLKSNKGIHEKDLKSRQNSKHDAKIVSKPNKKDEKNLQLVSYDSELESSDDEVYENRSRINSEEDGTDFFKLSSKVDSDFPEGETDFDHFHSTKTVENSFFDDNLYAETSKTFVHPSQTYNLASTSMDFNDDDDDLEDKDEEARRLIYEHEIKQLNAAAADVKPYGLPEDLDIVDVSVDNQLGNVRENLLRNITDASRTKDAMLEAARLASAGGGKSKKDKPSQVAKRKHQITYLAHLAREREETLKNEWAQNRQTRREAQMRYGF